MRGWIQIFIMQIPANTLDMMYRCLKWEFCYPGRKLSAVGFYSVQIRDGGTEKKKINHEGRESIRPSAPFSRHIFLGSRAGRLGESTRVNSSRLGQHGMQAIGSTRFFTRLPGEKWHRHRHVSRWRCVISIKKNLFKSNLIVRVLISYFACNVSSV